MNQTPPSQPADPAAGDAIRLRTLAVGFVLCGAICILTPFNNIYHQATLLGGGHFPMAPFILFFWLTAAAGIAGAIFRHNRLLSAKEIMVIWIMTVLVSGIAYTGLVRTFFINLTAPFYYTTVENQWTEILHPLLPELWYPEQPAIKLFYEGLAGGREMNWIDVIRNIPWGEWRMPLLLWSAFILTCYGVMICIINLLSRQWLHNERMNLPLLQVPQLMQEALENRRLGRFFKDRWLLVGLSLAAGLHLINGLSVYYPSVPQIPTLILAGTYFPKYGLFAGFSKLKIYIYPAFIGFAFLTTRRISFSFWFFFIVCGLLIGLLGIMGYNIPAAALGVTFGPTLSHPEETQMIGAYLVFFLFLVWLGRGTFYDTVRHAFNPGEAKRTRTEWISIRLSFWGMVTGLVLIVLWGWFFGMALHVSFLVVCAFFMAMVVATRVICQGGLPYFTLTAAPVDGITAIFGTRFFSSAGILVAAVMQKVLFLDLRESLMPSLLHAAKVTHQNRNRRLLLFGVAFSLLIGIVCSGIAMLALCYKFGVRELPLDWATRTTVSVYENVHTFVELPPRSDYWVLLFSILGACVMLLLVACYHRFHWWPIHPIGYLTAYSSAMRILWFSFLIGWLCNALCMRYGGINLFKRLRYFFAGLIIGDFLMAGIWSVIGLMSDISYQVLPS